MLLERFNALQIAIKQLQVTARTPISIDQGLLDTCRFISNMKGIVYVIGNGGSAGIASHFANDLLKALSIPAATLVDSNVLTCLANDLGYEHIYAHALKIMMKPEDVLVAISSSGQSENILKAVKVAKNIQAPVITLSGFLEDNPLRGMGNVNFFIDKSDYGLVEMGHFFILHTLIDLWKPLLKKLNVELLYALKD